MTTYWIVAQDGQEWGRPTSLTAAIRQAEALTESQGNDGVWHVEYSPPSAQSSGTDDLEDAQWEAENS